MSSHYSYYTKGQLRQEKRAARPTANASERRFVIGER